MFLPGRECALQVDSLCDDGVEGAIEELSAELDLYGVYV